MSRNPAFYIQEIEPFNTVEMNGKQYEAFRIRFIPQQPGVVTLTEFKFAPKENNEVKEAKKHKRRFVFRELRS